MIEKQDNKRQKSKRLPGSKLQRNKARKLLSCSKINDSKWLVWGGRKTHYVIKIDGVWSCDCPRSKEDNLICSHVIKVMFETNELTKGVTL